MSGPHHGPHAPSHEQLSGGGPPPGPYSLFGVRKSKGRHGGEAIAQPSVVWVGMIAIVTVGEKMTGAPPGHAIPFLLLTLGWWYSGIAST